jgi:hypothetical protein
VQHSMWKPMRLRSLRFFQAKCWCPWSMNLWAVQHGVIWRSSWTSSLASLRSVPSFSLRRICWLKTWSSGRKTQSQSAGQGPFGFDQKDAWRQEDSLREEEAGGSQVKGQDWVKGGSTIVFIWFFEYETLIPCASQAKTFRSIKAIIVRQLCLQWGGSWFPTKQVSGFFELLMYYIWNISDFLAIMLRCSNSNTWLDL